MTHDERTFGAAVTPPHRPRPLTASTTGEAPPFGEGLRPGSGEGAGSPPTGASAPRRSDAEPDGEDRTSEYIVGEGGGG
jgi:hypothetical protein